jgi:hypothetical protein
MKIFEGRSRTGPDYENVITANPILRDGACKICPSFAAVYDERLRP